MSGTATMRTTALEPGLSPKIDNVARLLDFSALMSPQESPALLSMATPVAPARSLRLRVAPLLSSYWPQYTPAHQSNFKMHEQRRVWILGRRRSVYRRLLS